ncbi:MAG: hypothetical protein Q4G51_05530 [Dermatophilus congolensis]|nr:hypothetical protein [Dermatophilus congolensis]
MSEEFTVVVDAMFAEKVGEDGLKEYAKTVASVAEWAPGHPVDEVMQALTQGWSAVDLNVDPIEAEKLATFMTGDQGDFSVATEDGTVLYKHSERSPIGDAAGQGAGKADQTGQSDQSGQGTSAQGVEPAEGPAMS